MIDKTLYRDPKDFQIGYPKTMQLPPKTAKVGKYKKGGPVQLELPLEQKPSAEIINLLDYLKPNSPIFEWWKSKVDNGENIKMASVDDIAPYLSKFFSAKQLEAMTEKEMLDKLQELIEAKQL